ncbi:DUF4352 domain-containing protein [Streptomyces sp. TRM 70351]|uniref:DUF4352 domain-containing protein n=1 Tax=Streptomyces sp. TRM 70351 TaxID=3116552 RepID=UPI002E7BAD58|nr:DUF4352 domain-containing protein [Streptomyces sp. TRM 70351]MEE1929434.1 DUF4352 domain-containing protein [Streptomyces sp. TRM 70351]
MSANTTRARHLAAAAAAAVLALGGLTACGMDEPTKADTAGNAQQDTGTDTTGGTGDAGDAGDAEDTAGNSGEGGPYAGGETAVYDSGLKVTVSKATAYTPGEYAIGHTAGNDAHQVTITLENTGDENVSADLLIVTARAGEEGTSAEEIYDDTVGEGFTGELLPGKKATAAYAFDAPADAAVLDLEVELLDFSTAPAQWSLTL